MEEGSSPRHHEHHLVTTRCCVVAALLMTTLSTLTSLRFRLALPAHILEKVLEEARSCFRSSCVCRCAITWSSAAGPRKPQLTHSWKTSHKSNPSWLQRKPRHLCESHLTLDQYSPTSIMHSQTSFTSRSSFWPATFLGSTSLKRCKSSRAAWNKQHGAAVRYEQRCCDVISTSLGVGTFVGKADGPSKKQNSAIGRLSKTEGGKARRWDEEDHLNLNHSPNIGALIGAFWFFEFWGTWGSAASFQIELSVHQC